MSFMLRAAKAVVKVTSPYRHLKSAWEGLRFLRSNRTLILEMAKREIANRYAGQQLGALWSVLHPMFQMALLVFVFAIVFKQRIGGTVELPRDYTIYILSGLGAWLSLVPILSIAPTSVIANSALIKQFTFDAKVLCAKDTAVNALVWVVSVLVVMAYTVLRYGECPWTYVLIPVLAATHFATAIGCAWVISSLAVFFRDLKDIITMAMMVMVYLLPVVYLPSWVPVAFRPVIYANPFSYLIWIYQDVFYFGRIEHPVAWFMAPLFAFIAFSSGYRLFSRLQPMFGRAL